MLEKGDAMVLYTKQGRLMNLSIKDKLVTIMSNPENDGCTQREIAKKAKVCTRTVQNYLIPEVWEEIHQRRLDVIKKSLALVDKAVYEKAVGGDMTAARLLYGRWEDVKRHQALVDLEEENSAELEEIERLEKQIKELECVEYAGDGTSS